MGVDGRSTSADYYIRTSRRFLAQAQEEFNRGDMLQASEKAWGAAAQAVKATAEQRGWEHSTHVRLFENIKRISQETGDAELHDLFHVANSLHQNFYEGWQTDDSVQRGIQRVKVLVERLDAHNARR
ncbi:MAG: PaREP1 family protein [Chloroflexota bacterium]|nr:PaREP1 family protein [Chloroflexota bacterium]MDE2840187.1 PaREP1 family protein [Chloroflexota bacterium]MDE2931140.1 PaREP1 family protein [Chloroflexota bacterium]